MGDRRIEYLPLAEISAALENPKRHADASIEASIRQFGYVEPMVRDDRTGRLIAGHGRLDELVRAQRAGDPPPKGIRARKRTWLVPVTVGWASADDAQAHAAGIAINHLAELGGWTYADVDRVLEDWTAGGADPAVLGFDQGSRDDLRALVEEHEIDLAALGMTPVLDGAIRAIILDYPLAEYEIVTERCRTLRAKRKLASNAELIATLIRQADR